MRAVYLAGTAIVRGARTKEEVMAKVQQGFGKMLAVSAANCCSFERLTLSA